MMKQLRLDYPTSVLSRMLVVSASGCYAWVDRPPSKRAREEVRLELEIKAAHKRTRQTYGPERLQRDLAEHGVRVGWSLQPLLRIGSEIPRQWQAMPARARDYARNIGYRSSYHPARNIRSLVGIDDLILGQ